MAASLLSLNSDRLLQEGQLFGVLFEALCYRDLVVYASLLPQAGSSPLRYYSDADGLEVDLIIELRDGRWAAKAEHLAFFYPIRGSSSTSSNGISFFAWIGAIYMALAVYTGYKHA